MEDRTKSTTLERHTSFFAVGANAGRGTVDGAILGTEIDISTGAAY